jgi:hypothetical protein
MHTATNSNLRLSWCLLSGAIAIGTFLPGASLHGQVLNSYINSDWLRFAVFSAVGAIPIVAWKPRTGIAIALSMAILSINLQFLRGGMLGRGIDVGGTVINLLGIAAGILIGLHIRRFGEKTRHQFTASGARSRSTSR